MAKFLAGFGVLLAVFGVFGIVDGLRDERELHPGTIVARGEFEIGVGSRRGSDASVTIESVDVRLDDTGETLNAQIPELAAAVEDIPVAVDVETEGRYHHHQRRHLP